MGFSIYTISCCECSTIRSLQTKYEFGALEVMVETVVFLTVERTTGLRFLMVAQEAMVVTSFSNQQRACLTYTNSEVLTLRVIMASQAEVKYQTVQMEKKLSTACQLAPKFTKSREPQTKSPTVYREATRSKLGSET